MKFSQLLGDDDAVSPVIGVILMVAITVILAAVIATFVLGLGDSVSNSAPQATFSYTSDDVSTSDIDADCAGGLDTGTALEITHDGGDSIEAQLITIQDGDDSDTWDDCSDAGSTSEISAGNSAVVGISESNTIRLTYSDGQGSSATLSTYEP